MYMYMYMYMGMGLTINFKGWFNAEIYTHTQVGYIIWNNGCRIRHVAVYIHMHVTVVLGEVRLQLLYMCQLKCLLQDCYLHVHIRY